MFWMDFHVIVKQDVSYVIITSMTTRLKRGIYLRVHRVQECTDFGRSQESGGFLLTRSQQWATMRTTQSALSEELLLPFKVRKKTGLKNESIDR